MTGLDGWLGVGWETSRMPVKGTLTLCGSNGESLKDFQYVNDMVRFTF